MGKDDSIDYDVFFSHAALDITFFACPIAAA